MRKGKDSWAKVGVVMALVSCCSGLGYGFWWQRQQQQQQQQQAGLQELEAQLDAYDAHIWPHHAMTLHGVGHSIADEMLRRLGDPKSPPIMSPYHGEETRAGGS